MTRGKETCKILKEIRRQIADKNDIAYVTSECHFHGECKGTCPKCEAELRYLETELSKRRQLGKAVAVAGISLGLASTFPACNAPQQQTDTPTSELKNMAELAEIDTTSMNAVPVIPPWDTTYTTLEGEIGSKLNNVKFEYIDRTTEMSIWGDEQMKELMTASKCGKNNDNEKYYSIAGGIEDEPAFPGGMQAFYAFLKENIKYPQAAREDSIAGTTIIKFVVNIDGTIGDVTIHRSSGSKILDEEAVRVVKSMPKWIPGNIKGKPVATYYNLPIKFQLSDDEKEKVLNAKDAKSSRKGRKE